MTRRKVIDRLASLSAASGTTGFAYPDTDNQMEAGVFSFAKRDDEARVWSELVTPLSRAGLALDVGCGLGAHAERLAAHFDDVILTDPDVGRARAAAQKLGWQLGERVFALPIEALREPDLASEFAFVQLIQVLGHLPLKHVVPALEIVRHLLAPGAHALFAVPFTGTLRDLTFVTAFDDVAGRVRPVEVDAPSYDRLARAPEDGKLPVRHFSMTSLLSAFAMAQLDVVETRPYHWFSHDTGDIFALVRRAI